MTIRNKKVLITGGTSGLGLALATEIQNRGALVHVCARNIPDEKVRSVTYHTCDVTKPEQVAELIKALGSIDLLINAAGIWLEGNFTNNTIDQIYQVVQTNLLGALYVCHAVIEGMQQTGGGVIVNVISTAGLNARAGEVVYAASKWGLRGFTVAIREELQGSGIRVIGVYPGGMATEFFKKAGHPKDVSAWMDPIEVAQTIIYAIEHDESQTIDTLILNRKK